MNVLAAELRRGSGKWLALPLILLGVWGVRRNIPVDGYSWPQTVYALGQASLFLGPLVAGFGAWAGTRARRRGLLGTEALSTRGTVIPGLVELGALALWCTVAYAVLVAVVFGRTSMSTYWSGPDMGRTVAGLIGLLLQVAVGYAAGRLVPYRLIPLVVAYGLFTYVNGVQSSQSFNTINLFMPDNLQLYDVYSRLKTEGPYLQIAWYLGLSGFALSLWAVWRARSAAAVAALTVALCVSVAGAFGVASMHGRENDDAAFVSFDCSGQAPQLCIHPSLSRERDRIEQEVAPVLARLAGTPFEVTRLEQRPRGIGGVPTAGAVAFHLDDYSQGSLDLLPGDVAGSVFDGIDVCLDTETGQFRPGANPDNLGVLAALSARLLDGQGDDTSTPLRRRVSNMTDARFRATLTRDAAAIRACTLTPAETT